MVDLLAEFADGHSRNQTLAACFAGLLHYLSCTVHHFFGHANEFAIFLGLSFLPFLDRHPLDLLHPAPRYPRVIRKPLNTLRNRFPQAADQARDHAYDVPQQRAVGRVMNVALYDSCIHPESVAIFQTQLHRRLHHQLIDSFQRLRSQSNKGAVEGVMLRHCLAVESRELAQRVAVGDVFP